MTITTNNQFAASAIRAPIASNFNAHGLDARFSIMKGTMPAELDTFDPALYASDVLAQFTNASGEINLTFSGNWVIIQGAILVPNAIATATGTATWWVRHHVSATGIAIMGDVTEETGDGSLKIDTLSVVSGQPVVFEGFGIEFAKPL